MLCRCGIVPFVLYNVVALLIFTINTSLYHAAY
jgi:hypothetical protein